MAYGKAQQPMDFKWQIARKIDRLDMGEYSTSSRFNRLIVIYGLVRAINPKENADDETVRIDEDGDQFRAVNPDILDSLDNSIKSLRNPEDKLKMEDESMSLGETDIETKLDAIWYELAEVVFRCKITDNVRVTEEAAP
jgi:hypothetical protein